MNATAVKPATTLRLSRAELRHRWRQLADNPVVAAIPCKVELNEKGAIVVSPPTVRHAFIQGFLTRELARQLARVPQLEETAPELGWAARLLAERFWPGPLTLVVKAGSPLAASAPDGGIAVRASGLRLARDLAEGLGAPVTSTSANRAGATPATTAEEAISALGPGLDLVLDGGACPGGLPSTIVDVRKTPPRLVREGRVAFEEILRALEDLSPP